MTDLDLRLACQEIADRLRESIRAEVRAELVQQAEQAIYGSSWFNSGVKRARLRLVEKPKQEKRTRSYNRRDGKPTLPDRIFDALYEGGLTAVDVACMVGEKLPIVRTTLTRLHREGRVQHDGQRPALYSLPAEAE
jgi:hypothetical protein